MKRSIVVAVGAVLVAACGGGDEWSATEADQCTLPNCGEIRPLHAVHQPLRAVGDAGLLAWRPDAAGHGALWFHPVRGAARLVAEDVPAETVAVDAAGSSVLYLRPRSGTPATGDWSGELHRWSVRTGEDRQLFDDARGGQFGACGDWVWSWHGVADAPNCGWASVVQLSTGRFFDVGESCDFLAMEKLASFSADCTRLATAPDLHGGVVVHDLGTDETTLLGGGTGRFVAAPALDRIVPAATRDGLVLHDLATGAAHELTGAATGRALRFSPSGRALLYDVESEEGRLLRLLGPDDLATTISAGFRRIEAIGFSPDERRVAWIELGFDEARRLVVHDTTTAQSRVIDEAAFSGNEGSIPAYEPEALHFSADGAQLLFVRHGPRALELVRFDMASDKVHLLGSLHDGGLPIVDGASGYFSFRDGGGALRLGSLESGDLWQVAPAGGDALFVGSNLAWTTGTAGWLVPLPAR